MSTEHAPSLAIHLSKTESPTVQNVSGDSLPLPNGINGEVSTPPVSSLTNGINMDDSHRVQPALTNGVTLDTVVVNGNGGIPIPAGPPPPYSEEPRRTRRPTIRTIPIDPEDEDYDGNNDRGEYTPLLNGGMRRRSRAASYSTVASYTGVGFFSIILGTQPSPIEHTPRSLRERRTRYFAPLFRRVYWRSLAHLMAINFPFALAAWVLLFCGVVLGTTLLITLPFGVVFWFLTLFLSRSFARAELHLQSQFHRPLRVAPADPPRPIFYRPRPAEDIERALTEPGAEIDIDPTIETSFLKNSYSMFMDPSSFQPIFYFLVIKASITLVVTPLVLALAPVS